MLKIIKQLKELNKKNKVPLFIAVDQEGGRVNRMPKEFLNIPPAYSLGKKGDVKLVQESASIIGEMLLNTGINMNLYPVLDIKRFKSNSAIGDRSYAENKEDVIKYTIPIIKEMQNKKIVAVAKHFPGHGLTKKDTHFFLPKINKKIKEIEQEDIMPFKEAIKNNIPAIMVGHLLVKDQDRFYPVSLSRKFIIGYLRKKLKFKGLVITDDLKMMAITIKYGHKRALQKAFYAGSDIIIFRYKEKEETKSIEKILSLAKSKKLKEGRINRSVKRILKVKEDYNLYNQKEIIGADINEINQKIEELKKRNRYGKEIY